MTQGMSQKREEKKQSSSLLIVACLSIFFLSACNTQTPEELLETARSHHSQGNTEVAIIELKNLLKQSPALIPAVSELNKIYVEKREYNNVITLLAPLVNKGLSDQEMLFSLTDALIQEAGFEQALSIIDHYPAAFETAQGLSLQAHCFAGLNKIDEALEYYQQALELDQNLISAHLGLAQEAIIKAEKLKSDHIDSKEFNETGQSDWVVSHKPVNNERANALENARDHLQKVLSLEPDNIVGNYLFATIFYVENNLTEAQRSINKVLKVDHDHKESLLLMSKLHLELAHLDKSESYLKRYIKITPNDLKARLYLSSIMLRKKQPDLALELLEDFSEQAKDDPEYLLIMGNSYLAKNENDQAIDYFEKAHAVFPNSALVKMYVAMGYLARNDEQKKDRGAAIQLLKEVLLIEPENEQAGISLITTLIQDNNYSKAENVAASVIKYHPKSLMPRYLSGMIWEGLGNHSKAIAAYKKVLDLKHSFIPASIRLARIYENMGDFKLAYNQYEAALNDSPYNSEVMTEMALFHQKQGNDQKAVELLELARDRNPDALTPRLLLGTYYLKRGNINAAQVILQELKNPGSERHDVQMYLGQVKLATGRYTEAVSVFSKLIQKEPNSPDLYANYGRALRLNGQIQEGRNALEMALILSEQSHPEALIELGELELTQKNYDKVVEVIKALQTKFPELAESYMLAGDLAMRQKNFTEGAKQYQLALQKSGSTKVILKLFEAYRQSGYTDKGFEILDKAISKKPDDLRLWMTYATSKQKSGDEGAAIDIYQNLLEKYPDNALLLNNLAWIYDGTDHQKAFELAERAYQVNPELPQIIDSYGWFSVLVGRVKEGLSLLEMAVEKSPSEPEFHYHLAEALVMTGEKTSARKSLELALGSQQKFNGRNNAEDLLLKLSRDSAVTTGL